MSEINSTGKAEDILGPENIAKYAVELAKNHITGENTRFPKWLTIRMENNYKQIVDLYKTLNRETGGGLAFTPTAEWLLDNFYIIEDQVKDIKLHLSKRYYSWLPLLKNGKMKGYPRIYALALALVNHTDGGISEAALVNFIGAYQDRQPLSMSELWAVAVMLRIALVERISYICEQVSLHHSQRNEAERLVNTIAEVLDDDEKYQNIINDRLDVKNDIDSPFIELLVQMLRKHGRKTSKVVGFIDEKVREKGFSLENLISLEHQNQAVRQVSIGNSITSLRMVAAIDWNEIFESLSKVEEILRRDPGGYYSQMDFASRDHYRHVLEKIARFYKISEIEVADKVLSCAQEASVGNQNQVSHVGYYLISSGRKNLEKKIGLKPRGFRAALNFLKGYPYSVYFASNALIFLSIVYGCLGYIQKQGTISPFLLLLSGLILLIPASEISVNIVNFVISRIYSPVVFPKLELSSGISGENSTMVIIPTLLPNEKRVKELLDKLEICYLANKDDNIYFALVGDFKDSVTQNMADDQQIIDTALKGISELNRVYSAEKAIFYFFHRQRKYNEAQKQWMGWERKRGAIIEFNDLLRGATDTGFTILSSQLSELPAVKYIITLDADTNLHMGAAKKLIGTMAHPLNKPMVDLEKGIVTKGYGILQPRIGVSLDSANKTLFSRVFAGQGGIDPYTTAVSDVYQDLFGEGIFTGKGIYELDTFQNILKDAMPENAILSHDLLEGSYIRAGLVTDIELIDGYPARYNSFSMRLHRWVRGDWQLLPWLGVKVRDRNGKWRKNPLTALSKWKILDNLRRSLLNPALFILILLAFTVLPGNSFFWLGIVFVVMAVPVLTYLTGNVFSRAYQASGSMETQTVIRGLRAGVYQTALQFIFISYQAYLMSDAVVRTLARVLVTGKNLLEWVPAADLESLLKNDLNSFYKKMVWSPFSGVLILALALTGQSSVPEIGAAALIFGLWSGAPYAAYRVSRDCAKKVELMNEQQKWALCRLTRKTWAYFEDMVTAEDNYLPPDNFQVEPPNGKAHRTSPTNIGLYLVSMLAARDFGYLGTADMLEKLDATLSIIEKMEKWEGHLYNWYDTLNLNVLRPRYISTVDSGNFVGYLMVLEQGLKEYVDNPTDYQVFTKGLLDTIRIFNEELDEGAVLVETGSLEAFLSADRHHARNWQELLDVIMAELTGEENRGKVLTSSWGNKLLTMVASFKKDESVADQFIHKQGENILKRIRVLINNTRFVTLFDPKRQLFSIGYNVEEGQLTKSYYDLLASEARLASYIAVTRGEVDKKHWFRLGRKLTQVDGHKGLVSWSGTMFEYFMPLLVMKSFEKSLLDATYSFVVKAQQTYGRKRKIPWGISESAYYAFDIDLNYQYKAFGVPELGFKRGLSSELVVAPYATVLALTIDPKEAIENLSRFGRDGLEGDYGLYEAVDYTPARVKLRGRRAVIKSFMVHHQGMSILALSNYLNDNIMQRRFHTNPVTRSGEFLLQERMPQNISITRELKEEYPSFARKTVSDTEVIRKYGLPDSELPKVHLLSNGSYSVMITDGGSGYSKNNEMAVARWNEGLQCSSSGFFIYIQNINSNNVWSATYEPYNIEPGEYKAVFSPDKAEFLRKDGNIETHTQIVVSPEDNVEIRTVTLTNNSQYPRVVEVTSYLEVVLTQPDADLAHPAFSNLFVKTEYVQKYDCLLAVRRPRAAGKNPLFAVHTIAVEGEAVGSLQYETDRAKFIGRNRGLHNPVAMDVDQPLSNTVGAVLDPIMSLRRRVRIEAGHSVRISYTLAAAGKRQEALKLADKYRDPKAVERAFELAWNHSRIEAEYLDIGSTELEVFMNMVPSVLYPGPGRRKFEEFILRNQKGQPCLWPFGISGDVPMILVILNDIEQIDIAGRILKGHGFWRLKGLKVDLIFLTEDKGGYVQPLQDSIKEAIYTSHAREMLGRTGGVYLLNANIMADEEKVLLHAAARIIISGGGGPIEDQLVWENKEVEIPFVREAIVPDVPKVDEAELQRRIPKFDPSLLGFYNGIGGFSEDGGEYVIHLKEGQHTPAPWINVIANPMFGFNITEVGAGYTWAENSRENKLTPWYNDPVTDLPGEAIYLRNEQTGEYWGITPQPIREKEDYTVRHGKGYSTFEHTSHGIGQVLTEFAALNDSVKICLIRLKNLTQAPVKLSSTYYIRPVLGVNEKVNAQYINTQSHGEKGVLLIRNSYNCDFPGRIAFIDTSETNRTFTGDGNEFIGINGTMERPAAMERERLTCTTGAGLTPCAAMQVKVCLEPDETKEIVFLLGQGRDLSEVMSMADKYNSVTAARTELAVIGEFWAEKLGIIQVSTPDKSMDILLNSWLQYQVVACRLWSRAAFYQSGGAYGFRDQLQDVMAVTITWPELTRKQILLHSAHQFVEGDVQHWWHPGVDKGIRTRYSDDFLWLPYVTADYIQCTDDWTILDEITGFMEDAPLPAGEDERYSIPKISDEKDTLYSHCIRSIDNALKFGEHGIPLMGSGDWNDGMNTVGNKGKGESVWLGWFLITVLQKFVPICMARDDRQKAKIYAVTAKNIAENIEKHAWDGSWYRRAYFDDGTPLGSAENNECKIDAIAQSWSVISGMGKIERAKEAMKAVDNYLVDREAGIIKLLSPPFGEGHLEPGYIKGYIPGVRENGGQYSHAAIWTIMAFAKLGCGDKVGELFHLINPINHTRTSIDSMRYKVEPYVLAADVYAVDPNRGRGGWSWYTGAAGWMYRVGIEHILGIKKMGSNLYFDPCIPGDWPEFQVQFRLSRTLYRIRIQNPAGVNKGVKRVIMNGSEVPGGNISIINDGGEHTIEVIMGNKDAD